MSFTVRDGKFDVVIVAGPRVEVWPSTGARALSALCAEMGLTVGLIGGDTLFARGVIPLPGTGGLVLAEDLQRRIHRFQARAVVRVRRPTFLPDPFPGWQSHGLVPLDTAEKLKRDSSVPWGPATAILGTGNRALKFGSSLLESGVTIVFCLEAHAQWGAKRFAGWEVERRRFEMAGGRIIEGKPTSLMPKRPLVWELRAEDSQGIRIIEVGRVVSAGPFRPEPGVREYPPGSFLFELEQTAGNTRAEDVEGWALEEERGRWLGGKIAKALLTDLGPRREDLEKIFRRARTRLKRYARHFEAPFTPAYQGKWTSAHDMRQIRGFSGVPQGAQKTRPMASIECFEEIPCNLCEKACPENAIDFSRKKGRILTETDCTGCGLCVTACPSGTPLVIQEREDRSISQVALSWRGNRAWSVGEFATLVNRRGDHLGSARVSALLPASQPEHQIVQLDVPTHLAWEARGMRRPKAPAVSTDENYTAAMKERLDDKVEIHLNGEKRLVRDRIRLSLALFEIGQARPGDVLYCPDGSCGLCQVEVDGVRKLACREQVHRGMSVKLEGREDSAERNSQLCPCQGIRREDVLERVRQGRLRSPEAVLSTSPVCRGKCHGQLCSEAFKRLLESEGIDASQWIDWGFPWTDWVLAPGSHD